MPIDMLGKTVPAATPSQVTWHMVWLFTTDHDYTMLHMQSCCVVNTQPLVLALC